jgi:hypothetical protein
MAVSMEKVRGHHQVSTREAVVSWMAVLLAALWQLGKLLALHAGSAAAGAWSLLWRRRKARRGSRGGRGGSAVQQWWRQLRSYVHQQRCGGRQKGEEAELVETHEGGSRGAAQEAAAPQARARGGTNGWRGNRASCWRWWQRVLLVLLL